MEGLPLKLKLTMGELLNAALGTRQVTKKHFKILRLFIDILLDKLACSDEEVTVDGTLALCLEKLLRSSQPPEIPANTEGVVKFADKFEKVENFQRDLSALEALYEDHLKDIRAFNSQYHEAFVCGVWCPFSTPCEDSCLLPEPENIIACGLVQHAEFIYRLRQRITYPLLRRLLRCHVQMEGCAVKLQELIEYVEEERKKFALLHLAVQRVEALRQTVTDHEQEFHDTIDELQQMFDAKMDKLHMPALKMYVNNTTKQIAELLKMHAKPSDCRKCEKKMTVTPMKCLSCSSETCKRQKIEFQYPPKHGAYCGCVVCKTPRRITLRDFIQNIDLDKYIDNMRNPTMPSAAGSLLRFK